MKGLGRNIHYQLRRSHKLLCGTIFYTLICLLVLFVFNFGDGGNIRSLMISMGNTYGIVMAFFLVFINAFVSNSGFFDTAVSFGSNRRAGSLAVIISQHVTMLEVAVLLFAAGFLSEAEDMESLQIVKQCPVFIAGIFVIMVALASILNATLLKCDTKAGSVLFVFSLFVSIAFLLGTLAVLFSQKAETLGRWNHPLVIFAGLLLDGLTAFWYCSEARKADFKVTQGMAARAMM